MKIVITTSLSMLLLLHFSFGQTYTIKGKIKKLESDSLLILKFKGDNIEASKIKVSKGNFVYEDSIAEPYFIQILKMAKGSNETIGKLADILVEPGIINIDGISDHYDSLKIRGSKSDLILKMYLKEDKLLSKKWDSLKLIYDDFESKGDTLNRKKTGKELNSITLKQRVPLLKSYVKKYNNEIIGALIPNFCTLREVLKKEDYLDMFNFLTDEIKQTNYGQSIYNRTK